MTPIFPSNCIRYQTLEAKRDTKAAASPIDVEEDCAEDVQGKRKRISQVSNKIGFQNFQRSERNKIGTPLFEDRKENIKIDLNASSSASSESSFAYRALNLPLAYSALKADCEDQSDPSSQPESDVEECDKANFKVETIKEQTSHLLREARQALETGPVHLKEIEIKCYWKLQFPMGGEPHRCLKSEEMQKLFEGFLSEESDDEYAPDPFSRRATVSFETFSGVVKDAEAQNLEGAKIREAFIKDWIKLLTSGGISIEETAASFIKIAVRRDLLLTLNYPEYAEKMQAVQMLGDSPEQDQRILGIARSLCNEASLLIFI